MLTQIDGIREEWLTEKGHYLLNQSEKLEIALHIVSLYFRHPLLMDATVNNSIRAERANIDMVKMILAAQTGDEDYNKLQIDLEYERPILCTNMTFMSNEHLMDFANAIAKNIYVFMSKDNDFYTSDFPITAYPHENNVRPMYMGLAQYGGEIMFTLSPGLALSIYDRECFKSDEDLDGNFIPADDKTIHRHNMMRYLYAQRHVFSLKPNFRLIDFIYEYNNRNHIFKTPNHRMSIVSGIGKY